MRLIDAGASTCHGLVYYPVNSEFPEPIPKHCEVLSVSDDLTYSLINFEDPKVPKIEKVDKKIVLTPHYARMGLEQSLLTNPKSMAAVICHEVAHLYLYHRGFHKIKFRHDLIMEHETDVAMFVLGLGKIVLGESDDIERLREIYRHFGVQRHWRYLTLEQLLFGQEEMVRRQNAFLSH